MRYFEQFELTYAFVGDADKTNPRNYPNSDYVKRTIVTLFG
jgi:hypothetical protein